LTRKEKLKNFKTKISALALLISILAGYFFIYSASANPAPSYGAKIKIASPVMWAVYTVNTVNLDYKVTLLPPPENTATVTSSYGRCYLDGTAIGEAHLGENSIVLQVPNGDHKLEIEYYVNYNTSRWNGGTVTSVQFTVNSGVAPSVSVDILPQNHTSLLIIGTDNCGADIFYSVDQRANFTVPKTQFNATDRGFQYNATLGLPDGQHTVTVYSKDAMGNCNTATKTFTVGTPALPSTEFLSNKNVPIGQPYIVSLIVAVATAAILVVVLASATVLILKRKNKETPKTT
jgi:hypothetical protein